MFVLIMFSCCTSNKSFERTMITSCNRFRESIKQRMIGLSLEIIALC